MLWRSAQRTVGKPDRGLARECSGSGPRCLPGFSLASHRVVWHEATEEFDLQYVKQVIQLWVDTALEFGDPIPEPKGRRLMYA
jgi:hypothetical protein